MSIVIPSQQLGTVWSGKVSVFNAAGQVIDWAKLPSKSVAIDQPTLVTVGNNGDGTFELRDKGLTGTVVVTLTSGAASTSITLTWVSNVNSTVPVAAQVVQNN